ncbi:MAG: glycosyltransferase [Verrucomicrobiales bacterium]
MTPASGWCIISATRSRRGLRTGFANARGDYAVTVDADLSYAPEHIGAMLDKILETRAEIVLASPYMKGGRTSNVPWSREMLSRWANRFLSRISPAFLHVHRNGAGL